MADDFLTIGTALSGVPKAIIEGQRTARKDKLEETALKDEIKANRELQYYKKQALDFELRNRQRLEDVGFYDAKAEVETAKLKLAKEQADAALAELDQMKSFRAIDRYFDDGFDATAINNLLRNYKSIKEAWNAQHVEKFDFNSTSQEDTILRNQALAQIYGLEDADDVSIASDSHNIDLKPIDPDGSEGPIPAYTEEDLNNLSKRFVKVINNEGVAEVRDMYELVGLTGYYQYADKKRKQQIEENFELRKLEAETLEAEGKPGKIEAEKVETLATAEEKLTQAELNRQKVQESRTEQRRKAEEFASEITPEERLSILSSAQDKINNDLPLTPREQVVWNQYQSELGKGKSDTKPSQLEQKISLTESAKQTLDNKGFLTGDVNYNDKSVRQALDVLEQTDPMSSQQSTRIEQAANIVELSTLATSGSDDVFKIENIEEVAGPFDIITRFWNRKASDTAKDPQKQLQAKNALILQIRRALSGVAVNPMERKDFNAAYGADSDKLPSILAGLHNALASEYRSLQTIQRDNPYLFRQRFGTNMDELKETIANVKARYVTMTAANEDKTEEELETMFTEAKQKELDRLNKGAPQINQPTQNKESELRSRLRQFKGQ